MYLDNKLLRLVVIPILAVIVYLIHYVKSAVLFLLSFFWDRQQELVVRTPESRFDGLAKLGYTFTPNYVNLPIGGGKTLPRVHYVDEGPKDAKETILCVHGEPSWSFLYRHMINRFTKAGYRVIAPDFIGFGKSDKYTHIISYSVELHTMTLRLLLDHLKVKNVTLVCQDWGGPIGLSVVKDCPSLFSRIVMMNTLISDGSDIALSNMYLSGLGYLWKSFARFCGHYLPIRTLFKMLLKGASDDVLDMYDAPFPSADHSAGPASFPTLLPMSPNYISSIDGKKTQEFLKSQWRGPSLIMFSDEDPLTGLFIPIFQSLFPNAKNHTIKGAGHFMQEEKGDEAAEQVISFIKSSN